MRPRTLNESQQQRLKRGHPEITLGLLQEAAALLTTSKQPRKHGAGLLAHFYAKHFAPHLSNDAGGPPVDITAHHQVQYLAVYS